MIPAARPEPLDRLLLRAALAPVLPSRPLERSWRELASALRRPGGLDALHGERQDLLGLVPAPAPAGADEDLAQRMAGVRRRNWAAAQPHLSVAREAMAVLERHGVAHRPGGDLALVELLGEPGTHPLRELCLRVAPAERGAAEAALGQDGWRRAAASLADPRGVKWNQNGSELWLDSAEPGGSAAVDRLFGLLTTERDWRPRARLLRLAGAGLLAGRFEPADWRELFATAARRRLLSAVLARLAMVRALVPEAAATPDQVEIPVPAPRDRLGYRLSAISPVLAEHLRAEERIVLGLAASLRAGWALDGNRQIPRATAVRLRARLSRAGGP